MAQMSYEEFMKFMKFNQKPEKKEFQNAPKNYVRYFGLKDDGDTGVVRFNVATLDDIKIVPKHRVKTVNGKYRSIACLRTNPEQPLDVCPLCAAGEKMAFRAYVPLISYEQDENGNTVAVPCMWEQAPRIRETLKSFTMDYGDLRDYIFKIVRHGKHGDTGTTYTIVPANPKVYKEEIFKKDFTGFDNLDFERFVTTKSVEEMNVFLDEGEFPNPFKKKEAAAPAAPKPTPAPAVKPEEEKPFIPQGNPLRTSEPIRGTYSTAPSSENTPTETPVLRRYSY